MVYERATQAPPGPDGGGGMVFQWQGRRDENSKTESLGKQNIEGVDAEGTRNTVEIPAGEIGNERAIEIVKLLHFTPAQFDGKPVPVMIKQEFLCAQSTCKALR